MSSVPRFMKAIALCVFATSVSVASAYDGPSYPPDYPFGANGDANHPNGYDGYPGNHPSNPNPPNGGPGGDGIGNGNGGQGGAGGPGGDGGDGGNSGPNGGHGGNGGEGGDATGDGRAGDGGDGGRGIDGGGDGGDGGESEAGRAGDGGDGGNATGDSRGGDAGDGGDSTSGEAGDGGEGGESEGEGCGGDGGDGGNGRPPGTGGDPGQGDGCRGDRGKNGRFVHGTITLLPAGLYHFDGMEDLAFVALQPGVTLLDIVPDITHWPDQAGSLFDFANVNEQPGPVVVSANEYHYDLALHPNSLVVERLRVNIEAVAYGPNPSVQVAFGASGEFATTPSLPVTIDQNTTLHQFTIVRPAGNDPFGAYLDMFQLDITDVYVTSFEVVDLGVKGDLNLDQQVDSSDFGIVLSNMYNSGNLGVEQGDANLDGVVDANDASIVLEDIPE